MTDKTVPVVDISELFSDTNDSGDLEISHEVNLGGASIRVLKEPHGWHILRSSSDPLSMIRAFVHPDDYASLDNKLQAMRKIDNEIFGKILTALVEAPTGHPTSASDDSPTS